MGILGDAIGGIISGVDTLTGGWASDQMTKSSAKRQYKYNSWLQQQNIDFQKYMAENAHQMEMADLQKAGLNPALTATGSSAGSIAGSSASQGTSGGQMADLSNIVNSINNTRMTNAQVESLKKNANANMINANANMTNAKTGVLVGKSTAKFNDERSRGKTKSYTGGGWGFTGGYSSTE